MLHLGNSLKINSIILCVLVSFGPLWVLSLLEEHKRIVGKISGNAQLVVM